MIGTVEKTLYMPLHKEIGKANNGTTELIVCVGAIARTPMIKHPDGRLWSLDWKTMIEMAVKAFEEDSACAQP